MNSASIVEQFDVVGNIVASSLLAARVYIAVDPFQSQCTVE